MAVETLSSYKKSLLKSRVGFGQSVESEAKRICKSEALKLINECIEDPESVSQEKLEEIRDRIKGLKKNLHVTVSPFKPSNNLGFYVRNVRNEGEVLHVELHGLTSKRPVLSLVRHILKEVYNVKMEQDPENKYKGILLREDRVGEAFFVKDGGLCIRLKKPKHKIFVKSWHDGFTIKCRIACPIEVKKRILPNLLLLEEDYWSGDGEMK